MSKNYKKNKALFVTNNPNPTQSNYVKKLDKMKMDGKFDHIQPGTIFHNVVYHDDWCSIYKGGNCNCDPDIVIMSDEEYKKKFSQ